MGEVYCALRDVIFINGGIFESNMLEWIAPVSV